MNQNNPASPKIIRKELPNGVTLYVDTTTAFRSASVVIGVIGGSRLETESENGLTHLIEHLLFKRTSRLGPKEIAFAIDEFGGDVNAFTDSESFCLYGTVVRERGVELLEFLLKLILDPQFTEEDVKIEKAIIRQEILEAEDDTADLVAQEFRKIYWAKDPLSRPIFGTVESLDKFSGEMARDFLIKSLKGRRVIVAVSGVSEAALPLGLLESLPVGERPTFSAKTAHPTTQAVKRAGQQTHICLGWRWPAITQKDYLAGLVLSTLLGHGTSSRLFQLLREEHGLCYDVGVHVDAYPDTAACLFYATFEAASFPKMCQLLSSEIEKLHREGIPEIEFERNCRMIRAQLEMEEDSPRGRLWRAVESELAVGRYVSTDEVLAKVDALDIKSAEQVARTYLTKDFYSVVGGKIPKKFEEHLRW